MAFDPFESSNSKLKAGTVATMENNRINFFKKMVYKCYKNTEKQVSQIITSKKSTQLICCDQ